MNKNTKKSLDDSPTVADYISMDEVEKNEAVQRAVIKLKMRVHEILSLLENGIMTEQIVHKKDDKDDKKA